MSVWTREAMEKLIRLYRNHPCLYNNHLREYRDQPTKKRAWEFIRNNLQDVRSGVTADQVKSKINSMRSQLSAEYAKLRFNDNYEPKLWFFNDLEFLKEFTRNASQERNTPTPNRMMNISRASSESRASSRNSMGSPASLYDFQTHSSRRDSPILARMRGENSSPAASLYGEEAEPHISAAEQLPEIASRSFELAAVADDIPTSSIYATPTATSIGSSIFDQKTEGAIYISSFSSPNMSPINNRDNQSGNENPSAFRVPTSSTPVVRPAQASEENQASVNNDATESSNIFSPPRRLEIDEEDVKNTYEIVVVSDNESSVFVPRPVKTELTYEMYTQTAGKPQTCEIEIQTDFIPEFAPKEVAETSIQTEDDLLQPVAKEVVETSIQTEEELSEPLEKNVSEIAVQTECETSGNEESANARKPVTEVTVSEIAVQTESERSGNEEPACARKPATEIFTQTDEEKTEETSFEGEQTKPHPNDELKRAQPEEMKIISASESTISRKVAVRESFVKTGKNALNQSEPEPEPSTSGVPFKSNKRKLPAEKIKIPTKFADSDSEYFSAEEDMPASPVPKKVKVVHVTSGTVLPNYFMPIQETSEASAFGRLIALKLEPLPFERRNEVETQILSVFNPPKKTSRFWPF